MKIDGARGVLFSVAGGYDMSMSEIQEAAEEITGAVSPDANIIFGASIRPELQDEIVITVVATGFDSDYYRQKRAEEEEARRNAEVMERVEAMKSQASEPVAAPIGSFDHSTASTNEFQNDFTTAPKENIWERIGKKDEEEDLDVPPSLRARFRNKK